MKTYKLEEVKEFAFGFLDSFYNGVIDLPIDEKNQMAIDELFRGTLEELRETTDFELVDEEEDF